MNISNILQQLRGKGLTQNQIAVSIGVSQSAISEMSRAKIGAKRPSYKVVDGLRRLACENGIDPDTMSVDASNGAPVTDEVLADGPPCQESSTPLEGVHA